MTDAARDAARAAERSPVMRGLARGGYAANGVVHGVLGAIIITISLGGSGEPDQAGAFDALSTVPLGLAGVWLLAGLLGALALWHAAQAVLVRGRGLRAWGRRVSPIAQSLVYVVLSGIAVTVALGARLDGDRSAREASEGLLATPGGVFVLGAAGLGIAIAGIAFASIGVRRSYDKVVRIPDGRRGVTLNVVAVIGYIGKGVAIGIVGILLLVAAFRQEARAAGGMDAAVHALLEQTLGPLLVFLVGLGLLSYTVFSFFRVRYAKL